MDSMDNRLIRGMIPGGKMEMNDSKKICGHGGNVRFTESVRFRAFTLNN